MGPFQWFLFVYVLGGLTFLPLLVALILLYAHFTLPEEQKHGPRIADDPAQIVRAEDEKAVLKTATDDLAERFKRKHDADVAAGYFAVCRDYVPGGVNGKPPERLSPGGEVVASESPSVYQTMYRSIFDRSQKPTIEPNKDANGKSVKRANNVFYVVLRWVASMVSSCDILLTRCYRHGHLMLYDDIQQLEVRYVISLEHHDVDLYSGGDYIPEGELWIKRNAIRLQRKQTQVGDKPSPPFFLFSENLSEKEDFYFALLRNQEKSIGQNPPVPQEFETRHIVTLVQKLHSSEEQLQTRWLNAILGRMFLAIYKTPDVEQFIREKLTKKISRVKKPNFVTKLALQQIYMGDGAPFITNPRLKDLTVNGDCTIEADVKYTGNFRIEIAATARIDLGTRFKAREVDMVLAATCKKLEGHALIRFKPSPSNRLWFTFEKMPQIDLTLEPIVSSRQITYNIVLRAIESRIREVIAETICLPFWDDIPFLDTSNEKFRGGIWKKDPISPISTEIQHEASEDEAEAGEEGTKPAPQPLKARNEKTMSMPVLPDIKGGSLVSNLLSSPDGGLKAAIGGSGEKSPRPTTPRMMRSTSFASAANPMVSVDHADGNTPTRASELLQRDSASAFLKDLSTRSSTTSASATPASSPPMESAIAAVIKQRADSDASKMSAEGSVLTQGVNSSRESLSVPTSGLGTSNPNTPTSTSRPSSVHENQPHGKGLAASAKSLTAGDRKHALAQITAATAAAQKWGWGVLARNKQQDTKTQEGERTSRPLHTEPMGRGHPLPPPGIPLPPPPRSSTIANPFAKPKRKPVPPPLLPKRPEAREPSSGKSSSRPQIPERRRRQSSMQLNSDNAADEVLVVEAPAESAPTSPNVSGDEHHDDFFGHGESPAAGVEVERLRPPLPSRARSADRDSFVKMSIAEQSLDQGL